jgi:hypothetical protein
MMKKLMLDVSALSVDSFPTAEVDAELMGTVHANVATRGCSGTAASCYTSCRADLRDACTCPPPA